MNRFRLIDEVSIYRPSVGSFHVLHQNLYSPVGQALLRVPFQAVNLLHLSTSYIRIFGISTPFIKAKRYIIIPFYSEQIITNLSPKGD